MKILKNKIVIALIVLIVSVIFISNNMELVNTNPFGEVELSSVVFATKDTNGSRIIIDTSGQRVLRVNSEDEIDLLILGGESFNEARRVITDKDNNIYLYDITKEEGGFRVAKEKIIKFSSSGELIEVVFSVEHEMPLLVGQMMEMFADGDSIGFVLNNEESFSSFDSKNQLINEYSFGRPVSEVVNYAVDQNNNAIYYSSRHGEVYKYEEGSDDGLVFDSKSSDYLCIPREVTVDSEGVVYFTDIGTRAVYKILENGTIEPLIYDGEIGVETYYKYIFYYSNANNGLITVTSDYVAEYVEGEFGEIWSAKLNMINMMIALIIWILLALIVLASLYLLYKLTRIVLQRGTKVIILTAGIIVAVSLIASLLLLIVLPGFQERLLDSELMRAEALATITSDLLPKEAYKRINEPSDYLNEDYKAVQDTVNGIFLSEGHGISDFYCMLYTIQDYTTEEDTEDNKSLEDGIITVTYSLEEYTGAVFPYDWEFEDSDEEEIIATKEGKVYKSLSNSEGSYLFVLNPIIDEEGEVVGLIEVGKDLNAFNEMTQSMIKDLFLNVLVMTVVIVLISLEAIVFLSGRQQFKGLKKGGNKEKNKFLLPADLLRILVFGVFFLTNMSTSFLPLYAMDIAKSETFLSMPLEVYAAIPIAAEVLFGALFSIFGTVFIRRFGLRGSAVISSGLFSSGLVLRLLIPNIWVLTLGNAIMGCGWGIMLLIVNTIIASSSEEEKNKGFAGQSAATLSGISCGIVFGGFIVNWLDYRMVFVFAAIMSLSMLIHTTMYFKYSVYSVVDSGEEEAGTMRMWSFLLSRGVLRYFVLIVIPVLAGSYFLIYLYPILGAEYGLTPSYVGYSYLINGICVILLSNVLTDYFIKNTSKEYALVFSSLIYAVAFILVATYQNIPSLLASLVLLGVSDSFGLPIQTSYYTDLPAVKHYGFDKAMGVYSLFENIAQTGGAFLFSYVLLIGVENGLQLVVGIMAVLAAIFALMHSIESRRVKKLELTDT